MSTVPFETHASVAQRKNDASGAWTCAKLAVTGVAVTGFWVFAFFVVIPAMFGK
jgi:hypothetical protein